MSFREASNVCLVIVVAFFLSFPVASTMLNGAGLWLPEWLEVGNKASVLEMRNYTVLPELNKETIASGKYQAQYEKYLSDHVPMRDEVILANATLQRILIEIANSPKGYDCYPTYYESIILYTPRVQTLFRLPTVLDDKTVNTAAESLGGLQQLASDYPNTKFVIYIVQGGQYASVNPAYKYMHFATTGKDASQALMAPLYNGPSNISVLTTKCNSEQEYYSEFFHTDHHWNSKGAVSAYNAMATASGIPPLENPTRTDFPNDYLIGSYARWGLCLHEEPIFDLGGNGNELVIVNPDGTREPYTHSQWLDSTPPTRWYTFHDYFYEFLKSGSTIENDKANGSALLVSDSYGADLVPMLGSAYHNLSFVKDMHSDTKIDKSSSLRALLKQQDYDCVYIVASCNNYINQSKRSPGYFK